jgi:FKBP-type peptidyl-prolyl cis-trans isomerase
MNKQTVLLVTMFLVFIGAVVGAYFVFQSTQESGKAENSKYSPANSADELLAKSKTEQVQESQNTGLKVQGANTENSNSSNSLPSPKNFSVYEKYANDETASYIDIKKGTGEPVETGDKVAMLYKGWLTNGELFDQSRKNEQGQIEPFTLELGAGQVIPGWEQTIVGMQQGGTRRLIVPYVAGYGEAGQGLIPAKAMLIFDVELVDIQKKDLNPPGSILP